MIEDIVKLTSNQPKEVFRLATVKSTTGGTIRVQFDGETEPSEMSYAYLESMGRPSNGDRVLMASVGGSYVALGKLSSGSMPLGVPMALKLATARNISLSGDASGSVSFDGSANVSLPVTVLFAASVNNTGTSFTGGIQFRAQYQNQLEFRTGPSASWYKLALG